MMMPSRAAFMSLALLFLVAGGHSKVDLTKNIVGLTTDTAEIYDAKANKWSSAGKMSRQRGLPCRRAIMMSEKPPRRSTSGSRRPVLRSGPA